MDPRLALSKQVELSLQALENRSQMVAGRRERDSLRDT